MALDLQEQDQLDALKNFWDRWGSTVIVSLAAALLIGSGVRVWYWYGERQATRASVVLQQLEAAAGTGELKAMALPAAALRKDYPSTLQATMGQLRAAGVMLQQDPPDTDGAFSALDWVRTSGFNARYREIARLRLAGIELDRKRPDAALALLAEKPGSPDMQGAYADRRGDILFAQGKASEAASAWEESLKLLPANSPLRPLVDLKKEAVAP